ncbi:carbohydrate kinase [Thermococcus sp.]|uniref:carbohydrate kinase family protein n=1 Tax=Thermococcus sp. TaxID=35749 RepID=UPI00263196CD|nr:carbohydrate kinase [Thermococcus sp.]
MIVSVGEVLIDMIALEDKPLAMVERFERHPGGAPANVAVGLSRLNVESVLISKVGRDPFGEFLARSLEKEGVKAVLSVDEQRHTGVVFVQLIGAKPEFILYDGVAYFNLREDEIPLEILMNSGAVHFGTVMFAREPSRSAVFKVIENLKGKTTLSYDVNIRLDLWKGREEEMLKDIKRALGLADIVKLGWEEYRYLAEKGINVEDFSAKLIAITLGSKGSMLISMEERVEVPPLKVEAVDTTGAGDAFMAGLLAALYYSGSLKAGKFEKDLLWKIGKFANLVAGLSVTRRGAWSVPRLDDIKTTPEFKALRGRI